VDWLIGLGIGMALLTQVTPERGRERIAANERAALAALRRIGVAQDRLRAVGAIDTDGDGRGEYGYLGELAGSAPLRIQGPVSQVPEVGTATLSPPLLPPAFQESHFDLTGDNVVRKDGYYFKLFLPDVQVLDTIAGIAESGAPGIGGASAGRLPSPDTGEALWCCYAWPVERGVTGNRAFFLSQRGPLLQTRNAGQGGAPVYDGVGPANVPTYDAAYSRVPVRPGGPLGMGALPGNPPRRALDGNRWVPVGR